MVSRRFRSAQRMKPCRNRRWRTSSSGHKRRAAKETTCTTTPTTSASGAQGREGGRDAPAYTTANKDRGFSPCLCPSSSGTPTHGSLSSARSARSRARIVKAIAAAALGSYAVSRMVAIARGSCVMRAERPCANSTLNGGSDGRNRCLGRSAALCARGGVLDSRVTDGAMTRFQIKPVASPPSTRDCWEVRAEGHPLRVFGPANLLDCLRADDAAISADRRRPRGYSRACCSWRPGPSTGVSSHVLTYSIFERCCAR